MRNIQSEIRRLNAFSANDNIDQIFLPSRTSDHPSFLLAAANRKTTSDAAVPHIGASSRGAPTSPSKQ